MTPPSGSPHDPACRAAGWDFEWAGRPEPVFMANVRWLSRYRRARCARPVPVADRLLEVFREPMGLWDGAGLVGDRLHVLPVLFHLLWSGALKADLPSGPETDSSPACLICEVPCR